MIGGGKVAKDKNGRRVITLTTKKKVNIHAIYVNVSVVVGTLVLLEMSATKGE